MTIGFFDRSEITGKYLGKDGKVLSCTSCGLLPYSKNPKFPPTGEGKKGILILGSSNTKVEDRNKKHWLGENGYLLKEQLKRYGVDLYEDCWSLNVIQCVSETQPTTHQIDCCRKGVIDTCKQLNPKLILCLGPIPLYCLFGNEYNKELGDFSIWRGFHIPGFELGCYVCPVYHPEYVLEKNTKECSLVWDLDIKEALRKLNTPLPDDKEPEIHFIDDLIPLLNITSGTISIDFETTGVKPHHPDHEIICASVALSPYFAYVFQIPRDKRELEPFLRLLRNPNVYKMGHNIKYEHIWARVKLGVEIQGWLWDSMLAAHILDNRRGVTGLKFLTFVHLGIGDYSSEISPYLKAKDAKNGNSFNHIYELIGTRQGLHKLMKYCALDTIYQYRIALMQQEIIWSPF